MNSCNAQRAAAGGASSSMMFLMRVEEWHQPLSSTVEDADDEYSPV